MAAFLGCGCTALVDAERKQCASDADCVARGPAFEGAVCEQSVCSVPTRWSCLDKPPASSAAASGSFTIRFFLRDTVTQEPKVGVSARACRRLDVECPSGIVPDVTTDGGGYATIVLPAGFDGYVRFDGTDIASTLYFFDPPVQADQSELRVSVNAPGTAAGLVKLTGAEPNDDLGVVLVTTFDCFGVAAKGVSVEPEGVGSGAKIFYVRNGLPSTTTSTTDETGYAGIVNAAPGTASFSAAIDDMTIGSVTVLVKPGAQTLARITPHGI